MYFDDFQVSHTTTVLEGGETRYVYGFNGKRKDQDGEFGSGVHYDYGFRIYNPQIGRFLSKDPISLQYPMLTPYQFASNKPINGIDLDGLEWTLVINSPEISAKLKDAIKNGNIIEQRRLTYWAINNNFPDKWSAEKAVSHAHKLYNDAGRLTYNPYDESGITVYLKSYLDNEGNYTTDAEKAESIDVSDEIHFESQNSLTGNYDWLFPVDVALWNNDNMEVPDGSKRYGDYDAQGYFGESLLVGNGKGMLAARIRGYGEFNYNVKGLKGSIDFISAGVLTGKYTGDGATPHNQFGKFSSFIGRGTLNPNTGEWQSLDKTWTGNSPGIGVSYGYEIGLKLDVNTEVKSEFLESKKQRETISRWIERQRKKDD